MELIERYVTAVEQYLPHRSAADVGTELRSLLTDSLEQRAAAAGRPPDEELAVEMLREFGEPREAAARYGEPRYLIGPRLYPVFMSVAGAIIVIRAIFAVCGKAVDAIVNGHGLNLEIAGRLVYDYCHGTVVALGLTVIGFAIAERAGANESAAEDAKDEWDPLTLPPLPAASPGKRLSLHEVEQTVWGDVILLVLLNFFPRWLGIPFGWHRHYMWLPLADLGIQLPVLLWNACWGGLLVFNLALLRERRWTLTLRRVEIGLGILGACALAVVLWRSGPSPIDMAWFTSHGWTASDDYPMFLAAVYKLARIAKAVVWGLLIWQIWGVWRSASRLLTPSPERLQSPSYGASNGAPNPE